MKKKEHLPLFGVGPVYVAAIVLATVAGISLSESGRIPNVELAMLRIPFLVTGIALILLGTYLLYAAAIQSRVHENIRKNTLVTTGVYGIVRNPIYSACMLMCTGAIFAANNLLLLALPVLYWLFMTVLMMNTEEKWLSDLYGEQYRAYCRRVNRCIPWFAK